MRGALHHRLTSLPLSLWRPGRFSPPSESIGPGSPLGGSPPLGTNICQRLEYSRRAFKAGDRSCALDRGYQCGCGRGGTRRTETAPPKVPRDNLGRINKSARYQLRLNAAGDCIDWVTHDGGAEQVYHEDPELDLWAKVQILLLAPLIPDSLL
jgi:hypothetical protein